MLILSGDKKNRYMVGGFLRKRCPHPSAGVKRTRKKNGEIKNDFIYLVDVEKREERKLCYHGTSWRAVHGNPQDSPSPPLLYGR